MDPQLLQSILGAMMQGQGQGAAPPMAPSPEPATQTPNPPLLDMFLHAQQPSPQDRHALMAGKISDLLYGLAQVRASKRHAELAPRQSQAGMVRARQEKNTAEQKQLGVARYQEAKDIYDAKIKRQQQKEDQAAGRKQAELDRAAAEAHALNLHNDTAKADDERRVFNEAGDLRIKLEGKTAAELRPIVQNEKERRQRIARDEASARDFGEAQSMARLQDSLRPPDKPPKPETGPKWSDKPGQADPRTGVRGPSERDVLGMMMSYDAGKSVDPNRDYLDSKAALERMFAYDPEKLKLAMQLFEEHAGKSLRERIIQDFASTGR